jgi:DNA ligase 1
MKRFTELFSKLDQTNKTRDRVAYLKAYFEEADDMDKLWTLALFTHKRPKRNVSTTQLRDWCQEVAEIPPWLFEESYQTVGDLAETISLLLPHPIAESDHTLSYWIAYLKELKQVSEEEKKNRILLAWRILTKDERFVFNKLITGSFRIGVSQSLVTQAVAAVVEKETSEISHRIMGNWDPLTTTFERLIITDNQQDDLSRPYPFCLAHPLQTSPDSLGEPGEWLIEWKWDGIRGQLIKRQGKVYLWSRGEELITEKFPEILEMAAGLPDGLVLDGEILPFQDEAPLPFGVLQTRIGRKNLSKKLLIEAPISFMAYDVLEFNYQDIRKQPMHDRRQILESIVTAESSSRLRLSQVVRGECWQEFEELRQSSRLYKAEGFMLKNRTSTYDAGRKRGNWWKWKIDPLTIDGVLIYAQKGHGRRADLYSDYTLAVWMGEQLVPFAKAYSGLTDVEMKAVDRFVKQHTQERFGPVRTVKPELVFEIAFEGIQESPRHKSGIALRFPRILRWRKDKKANEANSLDDLKELLNLYGK